jgi:hypothetical protein
MTHVDEQTLYADCTAKDYKGVGAVVDLGCWLGSTTIALARGLDRNPHPNVRNTRIHAYDRFIWEEWMEKMCPFPGSKLLRPGDSFLDEFQRRTAEWAKRIHVCQCDLLRAEWNGGPIELLLIDAMKSWDLANAIVHIFFPKLILGRSLILHQDFKNYYVPWIHLLQYRFRNHFERVHDVGCGCTVTFRYTSAIPPEDLRIEYSPDSFSAEEIDAAYEYSMSLVGSEWGRAEVAAAKVTHFVNQNQLDAARSVYAEFESRGVHIENEVVKASLQLQQTT